MALEVWEEGVVPCVSWCECRGAACVPPVRPRCSVIRFPRSLDDISGLTLPDVPVENQTFVVDPDKRDWMFCVRTPDADAMAAWLLWYHSVRPHPADSWWVWYRATEPRRSDKRCGS